MRIIKILLATLFSITLAACGGGGGGGAPTPTPTPATIPGAPVIGTATAGNTQATVAFTAPANNGGSAITGYTATCGTSTATGAASPLTVTELTNGSPYTCTVTATNAIGTSAASAASNSVTPSLTAPNAPVIGTATAGDTQATVAFTAPANNGGSAITGYTATCGTSTATGAASPLTVTGLTNGTTYTCTVTAINAIGTSAASAASNSVTPSPPNTWVTKSSMPTARWASGLGEIGGVIYVAGGYNPDPALGGHLTTVEAYTVASNSWLAKDFSVVQQTLPASAVVSGLLYTIGGMNCCRNTAIVVEYNPATDSRILKSPMPLGVRSNGAAGVINGIVYFVGGHNNIGSTTPTTPTTSTTPTTFNEAFDPVANRWSTKASMPTARTGLGAGVINGILYAVGGDTGGATFVGTLEAYDPVDNSWSTKASMPTPRADMVVGVINGILYVAGGNNGDHLATVEAYNPGTNTWSTVASLPTARTAAKGTVSNGVLYVIGGYTGANTAVGTVEAYTP